MPVSVGPGATALTRTPEAATSIATDLVSSYTACLLAGGVNGGSGSPLVAVDVDDAAAALSLLAAGQQDHMRNTGRRAQRNQLAIDPGSATAHFLDLAPVILYDPIRPALNLQVGKRVNKRIASVIVRPGVARHEAAHLIFKFRK